MYGSGVASAFVAGSNLNGEPTLFTIAEARKRNVPKIIAGYKALVASGSVEDEWVKATLPSMVRNMMIWAGQQRREEAPDKISRRLDNDAKAFEKAAKSGDYEATLRAFQTYQEDLPELGIAGSAKLDLS